MKKIAVNFYSGIIITFFILMVLGWISINLNHLQNTNINYIYGAALGLLPFLAAIFGFENSKKWGWLRSSLGKSLFFLSLGLLTWGIGTLVFAYYNIFLQVEVPYPSLADVFYILSWPLWAIGIMQLFHVTGAKYSLRSIKGKLLLLIIPIIIIIISYYLLVTIARGGEFSLALEDGILKLFFDLAYPIGDVVILSLSAMLYSLSYNYLGGKFKKVIYIILAGFILNYIADFSFSYTTTLGTFYTASWVDLLFTLAMFSLCLGVTMLDPGILNTDNQQ